MSDIKKLTNAVRAAVSGQAKGIEAIQSLVLTTEGVAALADIAERYVALAKGEKGCDEVKRLRALIRKSGMYMQVTESNFRLADEGEDGAPLTVKFRNECAVIEFAKSRAATESDPVGKALRAYVKACREAGIELEQATEMLAGEWTDEPAQA
jgi:hypothetical protein